MDGVERLGGSAAAEPDAWLRASRTRQRGINAACAYLRPLGRRPEPELRALCERLLRDLPLKTTPRACVAHVASCLDAWLGDLAEKHFASVRCTPEMLRAALLTVMPAHYSPHALFSREPPAQLIEALWRALPLALPPEQPLEMPRQSLRDSPRLQTRELALPCVPGIGRRRLAVFGPTLLSTAAAVWVMQRVFSPGGVSAIEVLLTVLFGINFLWIALTFWTGLLGLMMVRGSQTPHGLVTPSSSGPLPRTVLLMPAYNEAPERIFGGMEAMYESLRATGLLAYFDFFVLSDSTDPEAWIKEEILWNQLRQRLRATGRLFYRRRFNNTARKAGNIAEFCQRWGGHYEAMMVLDADSLMEGTTIVEMVRIMAANPHVGLLQTVPQVVNRNTMFARAQQFAGRLYGPVLARGLAAWHGSDGNYWGHNALIRVAAFAAHAELPVLGGRAPFGGHILSHDFVEAALLRRAGWGVYMLSELAGSYEESPPSLIEHAQRDRRWCQGNLQHMAVIGARGLHPLSRLHLLTGIMSYLSSPLWFAFLVVGVIAALQTRFELPQYFFPNRTPYPVWHLIDPELAIQLFTVTMAVLLAPKLFGWIAAVWRGEHRKFGGHVLLFANLLSEIIISALTAPIQMLFQSRFVLEVLRGHDSGWKSQARDESGVSWREAWRRHRHHTAAGMLLGLAAYAVAPPLAAWMAPALLGMLLAGPISYAGSRLALGRRLQRMGLLKIPEELEIPEIVASATQASAAIRAPEFSPSVLHAVVEDLDVHRLHMAMLSQYSPREVTAAIALAHYRVHRSARSEPLDGVVPEHLRAAALANAETLMRLWKRSR